MKPGRLSRSEWKVMNLCWRLGGATARQVFDQMERTGRSYQTIKTLLDRVTEKGFLKVKKLSHICVYHPVRSRKEAVAEAVREFVDEVLDNQIAPLYLHLAERPGLDEDELEQLRALLDEMEEE